MDRSKGVIKFNNRIIEAVENERLIGAIDRKTEALIRRKIYEVFSTINCKDFTGSNFTAIEKRYRQEADEILSGKPISLKRFAVDLNDVMQFVLFRIEAERKTINKIKTETDDENKLLQLITDNLNEAGSVFIVISDVLYDVENCVDELDLQYLLSSLCGNENQG